MVKKSYLEYVSAVASQLATWVPIVFLLLNIRSTAADTELFIKLVAISVGGVLWFAYQYRIATKMADEQGRLPRPELFWSLMTGKITSEVDDLDVNRQLLVIAPSDVTSDVEDLLPQNMRKAQGSAIIFFTIKEPAENASTREKELNGLREQLRAQNPVGIILIDNGKWDALREFDSVIRGWGATHSELPIVTVHAQAASGPGTSPSLGFSGIPRNSLNRPALLGLTNRLLQQTAIRGKLWKGTAGKLRYIALGAGACAIVSASIAAGFVVIAQTAQQDAEAALRASEQFREALTFSENYQSAFLDNSRAYRDESYSDSVSASAEQAAELLVASGAAALRDALQRAHGGAPKGTNVVLHGMVRNGPAFTVVEITRDPPTKSERQPFGYNPSQQHFEGIAACAVAIRAAVYWSGVSSMDPPRTDSMAAWSLSGPQIAEYSRRSHQLRFKNISCEYLKFPSEIPDDERRELLCVPVGSSATVGSVPVGSLCVSSNADRSWLHQAWVRNALGTAALWMAPFDWKSVATKRFGDLPSKFRNPQR